MYNACQKNLQVDHPIFDSLEFEKSKIKIFLNTDMTWQMEKSITHTDFNYPESPGPLTLC